MAIVTAHAEHDFDYAPEVVFDAAVAALVSLRFSGITPEKTTRRISAKYLSPYGDWAVLVQVQQLSWEGKALRCRLIIGSTPTNLSGAIENLNAAKEARVHMEQRVLHSVMLRLSGGKVDIAEVDTALPAAKPSQWGWIVWVLFALVALAIIFAVHVAEHP